MVKRYNPSAKIQRSTAPYEEEAISFVERCLDGEFVKYEAYRSLEAKYNKLVYGKICYNVAKRANLSCQEVQDRVEDFCLDHYKHFECYPMDIEVTDGVFIDFYPMMEIFAYSERQREQENAQS